MESFLSSRCSKAMVSFFSELAELLPLPKEGFMPLGKPLTWQYASAKMAINNIKKNNCFMQKL